jgi:transposase-like protein
MKFHALSESYPYLQGKEWEDFKESVRASGGNRQSIKYRLLENGDEQGLDGRNRLKACLELGLEPSLERVFLPDDQVASYIVDLNERRRHTPKETRAALAAALSQEGLSSRKIAAKLGVSQPTVIRDLKGDTNESPGRKTTHSSLDPDDELPSYQKPNGKRARRVPIGPNEFDWDKYNGSLGILFSLTVRLADLYQFKNTPAEKALGRKLQEFSKAFRDAYKQFAKTDPPADKREAKECPV